MKIKLLLITSILLLVFAIIFLWKGNETVGTGLLISSMLLNVIRGLINVWNNRILK